MSNRSTITVIDYCGIPAIQKTFMRGFEEYFDRELKAYIFLRERNFAFLPRLLFYTSNVIIIEKINFDSNAQADLLKANLVQVSEAIFTLWKFDCAHLDLHPKNCLITDNSEFYLFDYEHFYQYQDHLDYYNSYDLVGHPNPELLGIKGAEPFKYIDTQWRKSTGISICEIGKLFINQTILCD